MCEGSALGMMLNPAPRLDLGNLTFIFITYCGVLGRMERERGREDALLIPCTGSQPALNLPPDSPFPRFCGSRIDGGSIPVSASLRLGVAVFNPRLAPIIPQRPVRCEVKLRRCRKRQRILHLC